MKPTRNQSRIQPLAHLVAGLAITCVATAVSAQDFPTKPVRLISAYAAGSVTDVVARVIAPEMGKVLGQPVIVENRPGADTLIGTEHVARLSPADGYTVAVAIVSGLASMPALVKDLRFDPLKELPPVIDLTDSRLVFGSASKFPWKSVQELVNEAKAKPGKLNYGVASSLTRMLMQGLVKDLGITAQPVQFTGGGPWNTALGQGTVEMGFISESAAAALSTRLRGLAITGETRSPKFPETPTFKELGMPQYNGLIISLNVRAGTPKAAFDKLHAAAAHAIQMPEVKQRLLNAGFEAITDTSTASATRRLAEQGRFFAQIARDNPATN